MNAKVGQLIIPLLIVWSVSSCNWFYADAGELELLIPCRYDSGGLFTPGHPRGGHIFFVTSRLPAVQETTPSLWWQITVAYLVVFLLPQLVRSLGHPTRTI
jgi:hypothetical protein